MFVSHENTNSSKKKFQKPNILRKRSNLLNRTSNVRTSNKTATYESPDVQSLLTTSFINDQKNSDINIKVPGCKNNKTFVPIKHSVQKSKVDNNIIKVELDAASINQANVETKNMIYYGNSPSSNNEENQHQTSISVESLLMGEVVRQNIPISESDLQQNKEIENQNKPKWCLDFTQDSQKIIIEHYDGSQFEGLYLDQKSDIVSTMVPLAAVSSLRQDPQIVQDENYTPIPSLTSLASVPSLDDFSKAVSCEDFNSVVTIQNASTMPSTDQDLNNVDNFPSMTTIQKISMEQLITAPVRFKCEMPNCNKEFMSEQKLRKHMNSHNKDSITKPPRQTTVECPVKRIHENGLEEPCGRIFHVRDELAKHLNEEHTIEEAVYRCLECSRRFFWASGLRAHARAHAVRTGRAVLACPWPGCARVFRQPCRLREHARAHTGDKPYPCSYPNCGWSFRTASKLMRHARRHTGERRHACATCGRAFLRREHLRDHAARHHAPHARRLHACPHADCEQSFTNMSSLYMHMKKIHRKEQNNTPETLNKIENQELPKAPSENLFMVSLLEPNSLESVEEVGDTSAAAVGEDGHAARTHCTWPLARAEHYRHALDDDGQVEQSEGSESNIYTVRSDLFLHGNVLHNEDSEPMSGCVRADATALDAELLLDAPSVHLDQEELYTDAVDESSFRVFLLSGEELA
ncbi:oocyte zinc finger protein XlCOF28-like [Nymphalis io]|uniref:oocyte zinc finger protein XlCOF28-like n=1 Tax=Inachis io TaxID=171585 RepID=UPI0021696F19|nr:oocyte zinc finger protein XlCOF28-like [Nymphalis io]